MGWVLFLFHLQRESRENARVSFISVAIVVFDEVR